MKYKIVRKLMLLGLLLISSNSYSQTCQTQEDRFILDDFGTAIDTSTGLMWMRCYVGQTWNNSSCEGEAEKLNWQDAMDLANNYVFANKNDWRLPNIKELLSKEDWSCRPSASDINIWSPGTSWTSTPYSNDNNMAWIGNTYLSKEGLNIIRLVNGS
jgi:hypothetical protein